MIGESSNERTNQSIFETRNREVAESSDLAVTCKKIENKEMQSYSSNAGLSIQKEVLRVKRIKKINRDILQS